MLKGFRDFLLRGNVLDLAVGVIIGAAFTGVVNALAEGILTPLIGALIGQPNFSQFDWNGFGFGALLNALFSFFVTAFVLYFFIVTPVNNFSKRLKAQEEAEPPAPTMEEKLLTEIRDLQKQQLAALNGGLRSASTD